MVNTDVGRRRGPLRSWLLAGTLALGVATTVLNGGLWHEIAPSV